MSTTKEKRDNRYYGARITALKDIEERALQLPQEQRYAAAYGILRGYFESLLTNFAETFSAEQLAEMTRFSRKRAGYLYQGGSLNRLQKSLQFLLVVLGSITTRPRD